MALRLGSILPQLPADSHWLQGRLTSTEVDGRPLIVCFWKVDCCANEIVLPVLNHWFSEHHANSGLQVIAVAMDGSVSESGEGLPGNPSTHDVVARIQAIIEEQRLAIPVAVDSMQSWIASFSQPHIPSCYLFDRQSKLRHIQGGDQGLKLLEQRLHRILFEDIPVLTTS